MGAGGQFRKKMRLRENITQVYKIRRGQLQVTKFVDIWGLKLGDLLSFTVQQATWKLHMSKYT